jgi:hypothetical protein
MKLKTSIRAGERGCSPEARVYMEKALALENRIARCLARQGAVIPPNIGYDPVYYPPVVPPVNTPVVPPSVGGVVYPDRSGWCG